jgi:hypothetical protein
MQPNERDDQIFLFIVDETYGHSEDTWAEDSERYRLSLQQEFGVDFEEVNIGPGFDIPAFLTFLSTTTIPLWSLLFAAFFLGKPIKENLEAWHAIGKWVRKFFERPVYLSRNGAAAIAVEAVFEELGGIPKTLRLISYRAGHIAESGLVQELKTLESSKEISASPPTINLGLVWHIFEIEADGITLKVGVDGRIVEVVRLQ